MTVRSAFLNPTFKTCLIVSCLLLSGCSGWGSDEDKKPLEGTRISLFELESKSGEGTAASKDGSTNAADTGLSLPDIWSNQFWPQAGGYANHAMGHVALTTGQPKRQWSSSIGDGATSDLPLTAQPVIAEGKIFTLDTDATVRAFDRTSGKRLWSVDVKPEGEDDPVIGGGLAFSGGRLFVTAGFNELVTLNPSDGKLLWRKKINDAARGAPTAMPAQVFVITVANETIALKADDGTVQWNHQGLGETTGLLGASSPAANRDTVIPAYSSGEVYALRADNGAELWSDTISPLARMGKGSSFTDIRALPVVDKGLVIGISYGGRMAALEERTGNRIWEAQIAGSQTPWIVGNRVFVVTLDAEVQSYDITNGNRLWSQSLPRYKNPEDMKGPLVWYGPVLASNRLWVFASNGDVRILDPKDGTIQSQWSLGDDVAAAPVVAGETLYVLSTDGTLSAWK